MMFLFVELNSNECKGKDKPISSVANNKARGQAYAGLQCSSLRCRLLTIKCAANIDESAIEMFTTSIYSKSNEAIHNNA